MRFRAAKALREVRCFADCVAQETGDPADCHCAERDAILYDLEAERRIDARRNGYDR